MRINNWNIVRAKISSHAYYQIFCQVIFFMSFTKQNCCCKLFAIINLSQY